jgi:PTS system sorbose-specific IIC component
MELSVIQIILIFIWSSITGMGSVLDEFQTHRPLVACTVTGLILGDVTTGIILGGTLELIALGWMNIGAAQSPDSALASVISTILVVVGHQDIQKGIAIALPVAVAGQVLTVLVRTVTVAIQHAADKGAEKANFNRIIALHFFSLVFQAMRVAIPATLVAVFVDANAITRLLDAIPEVITGGLAVAGGMIVVVGYAMVLNMMYIKYLLPFFFAGFILGGYLDFSLLAFGILGLIIAIIYVQLNPNFTKTTGVVVSSSGELDDDELED